MPTIRRISRALTIQLLLLGIALPVLAVLQYRWIGRLTDAERQRSRAEAEFFAGAVAEGLGGELRKAFRIFLAPEFEEIPPLYDEWKEEALRPEFVESVYAAERNSDTWSLFRLDPERRQIDPVVWPKALQPMRVALQTLDERRPMPNWPDPLFSDVPALFIVQLPAERTTQFLFAVPFRVVIVQFSRKAFTESVVPALMERAGPGGTVMPYDVAIVANGTPLYRSQGWNHGTAVDATAEMSQLASAPVPPHLRISPPPPAKSGWKVLVRHHQGGVNALVASVRRKNLAVSAGILLILAASVAMLAGLVRRADRLRANEAAFVRVMTHELNTPVAVLRSAGENLKDGIVAADQVALYGSTIVEEADRLHHMIGEVLELAGLQARTGSQPLRPLRIEPIVQAAVDRCRLLANGSPMQIEADIEPNLPPVAAADQALTRAIQNLIVNAMRHGSEGEWVGVRVQRDGKHVAVTVEDRGPGIHPEDVRQLFEPFYRGKDSARVSGAGLGLAIVKQIAVDHGGTVSLERREQGAAFTIHLPASSGWTTGNGPANA